MLALTSEVPGKTTLLEAAHDISFSDSDQSGFDPVIEKSFLLPPRSFWLLCICCSLNHHCEFFLAPKLILPFLGVQQFFPSQVVVVYWDVLNVSFPETVCLCCKGLKGGKKGTWGVQCALWSPTEEATQVPLKWKSTLQSGQYFFCMLYCQMPVIQIVLIQVKHTC